jgi:hypothetical protein
MPDGSGACNVVDMQSAINGHWSQSTGADLSGQHGMSSDMTAGSPAIVAVAIDAIESTFARAANGANTRPAIKKTASSRQRWIERFTGTTSHDPTRDGSQVPSRNRGFVNIIQLDLTAALDQADPGRRNIAYGQNIFGRCGLR